MITISRSSMSTPPLALRSGVHRRSLGRPEAGEWQTNESDPRLPQASSSLPLTTEYSVVRSPSDVKIFAFTPNTAASCETSAAGIEAFHQRLVAVGQTRVPAGLESIFRQVLGDGIEHDGHGVEVTITRQFLG
jgi:hypothetical protein